MCHVLSNLEGNDMHIIRFHTAIPWPEKFTMGTVARKMFSTAPGSVHVAPRRVKCKTWPEKPVNLQLICIICACLSLHRIPDSGDLQAGEMSVHLPSQGGMRVRAHSEGSVSGHSTTMDSVISRRARRLPVRTKPFHKRCTDRSPYSHHLAM